MHGKFLAVMHEAQSDQLVVKFSGLLELNEIDNSGSFTTTVCCCKPVRLMFCESQDKFDVLILEGGL